MGKTQQPEKMQIWTALFAVSSSLYRMMEHAPDRDPLRWHMQDIAVRLLRETAASYFDGDTIEREPVERIMRQLLAVMELLNERSWIASHTMQTLTKQVWQLRHLLDQHDEERSQQRKAPVTTQKQSKSKQPKAVIKDKTVKKEEQRQEEEQPTALELYDYTRRQRQIITVLQEVNDAASASFFAETFPGVTARTIRRDLKSLVKDGVVVQEGSGRGVKYRLSTQ